ncbi:hypothetical protein [Actinokineospora sp. NBRC 105648]|uniref:hypothetical protein n=1 Tax=Actinokineospora sp. NBRC 105648 TaxID=3032206 RepID=UPI0024A5A773|nr:hypothetical protein [Actinokineospora sp. NBRC 105648]GLZ43636.1 hypothetical protein Acsp05_72600 [Actinokineospora sp. NBRC 105648]
MSHSYSQQTVKLLFGRAQRCAYPACDNPLILEHRSRLTVIAEIAHIRSEKPNGPRYDAAYPQSLIDEEENLLLLCGVHHKPVDDHDSAYPTEELLVWKCHQVDGADDRRLSDEQVQRIFLHYKLSQLNWDSFEKVCQALSVHVLGRGTEFHVGPGPHGGRDAWLHGRADGFPTPTAPWDGYIVMQALHFSSVSRAGSAPSRLKRRIEVDLDRWSQRTEDERPDYLIFATNLQVPASDTAVQSLITYIDHRVGELGLRGWQIWDDAQICHLLGVYPDVRQAVASLSVANEIVSGVLKNLTTSTLTANLRPGEPGQEAAFHAAYQAAGGLEVLGRALGKVQELDLGWLQHFAGGPRGEPSVLCALYGKAAVAVSTAVWNDIAAIGAGVVHGGSTGVGFPVSANPSQGGYIGSDAEVVDLVGGRWGRAEHGRLLRPSSGPVVWQTETALDSDASKDRDVWSSFTDQRDLRIRVAARIPLYAKTWRITGTGRARMLTAVDATQIAVFFHALAKRYGLRPRDGSWREIGPPDGHNNSRFAAYQIMADNTDGSPCISLCLRLTVPDGRDVEVLSVVDLRVDFTALAASASLPVDTLTLRLTFAEVTDFYVHAWQMAMGELLLAAVEEPLTVPPAGAPRLEFHIQNERIGISGQHESVPVLQMVDLSLLGTPRSAGPRTMSVGVTAALGLPPAEVSTAVSRALVWMVEDAGFVTPPATS